MSGETRLDSLAPVRTRDRLLKKWKGAEERGCDGGRKIAGQKWHMSVDTQGSVRNMAICCASTRDRDGLDAVIEDTMRKKMPRPERILADAGYQGQAEARTMAGVGVPIEIVAAARRTNEQ